MLQTFRQTAALLFGITILTLGMGMLYVLIVVRAREAGFSSQWIGIIQSAYQVGWLVAALIIPSLIHRVGHIRVFAAVAAATLLAAFVMYRSIRKAPPGHHGDLVAMASASPYTSVVIAAEEWSDDVEMMDNRSEKTRQSDDGKALNT